MRFLCCAFLLTCSLFLKIEAGLVDHLKPASNKTETHQMRNIDFIYMINLDRRTEKFQMASEQLKKYGITPYRFSAVNGWELTVQAINECGLKFQPHMTPLLATTYREEANGLQSHEYMTEYGRTYYRHCMAKGTLGCSLSHISILKDALESGYETIWVTEDDIEVIENPHLLSDLIDELDREVGKSNWDVFFTDVDYRVQEGEYLIAYGACKHPAMDCSPAARYSKYYTVNKQITNNLRRISARFGTHSMIIRRSGMEKLYHFFMKHNIFLPHDLENYLPRNLHRYAPTFDIVTNMLGAISDNGVNHLYKDDDSMLE